MEHQNEWIFAAMVVLFIVFVMTTAVRSEGFTQLDAEGHPKALKSNLGVPYPYGDPRGKNWWLGPSREAPQPRKWTKSVTPTYGSPDWRPELSPHGAHNPLPPEVGVELGPIGYEGVSSEIFREGGNGGRVAWEDLPRSSGAPIPGVDYQPNWEEAHEPLVGSTTVW